MTHSELIEIGRNWLIKPYSALAEYGHSGCGVILTEIVANTYGAEQPDVLGFCTKKSILIECKASRNDFLQDKNKVFRKMSDLALGNQRWYLVPKGIIKKEEVPSKWGLLEVDENNKIKCVVRAELQERNYQSEINILISLVRRLNVLENDHVAIKKYKPFNGIDGKTPSKNRATFYIKEVEK